MLVDRIGNPRLCDFGLARIILDEGASTSMTTTSEYTGTDRYLAIELLSEEPTSPTTASDIHALGCLGLEVSHGRSYLFSKGPSINVNRKRSCSLKSHTQSERIISAEW